MELMEIARQRYSVRKFDPRPVEEEKLQCILEFTRLAPTAKNNQPQKLLVVREKDGLAKLDKAAKVYGSPAAVIVCADMEQTWKRPYDGMDSGEIDASIVTTYMMMEATRLGLGSVWICFFDPVVLREEFKLPEHIVPVNILAIGYPAADAAPAERHYSRKPLEETVSFETHNW
jgi:nitroreductase